MLKIWGISEFWKLSVETLYDHMVEFFIVDLVLSLELHYVGIKQKMFGCWENVEIFFIGLYNNNTQFKNK